jgi:hypothetical protein
MVRKSVICIAATAMILGLVMTGGIDGKPADASSADARSHPAEWDEVQEFISRLNKATGKKYRLPTEAEWAQHPRWAAESNPVFIRTGHRSVLILCMLGIFLHYQGVSP